MNEKKCSGIKKINGIVRMVKMRFSACGAGGLNSEFSGPLVQQLI